MTSTKSSRNIPINWTKHLETENERELFEKMLRGSGKTLRRLKEIIEEYEKGIERSQISVKSFDENNWALKQAFRNGESNADKRIKDLVTFIER